MDYKTNNETISQGLYIVSTPIGNMRDITLRALDVLKGADIVLCEDTRVTRHLLSHYEIKVRKLWTYHDHNGPKMRPKVMEALQQMQSVVLITDAGTPALSDPGYRLVGAAIEQGFRVFPIPGASAFLAGLVVSGLATDKVLFAGFLPVKKGAKQKVLEQCTQVLATLVFYESAKRLQKSLALIAKLWPQRRVVVARELTKFYEEVRRDTAQNLADYYTENGAPKGEVVLLLDALTKEDQAYDIKVVETKLKSALKSHTVRDSTDLIANDLKIPRREVYQLALKLNKGPSSS